MFPTGGTSGRLLWCTVLLPCALGCTGDVTGIMVVVDTDLCVGTDVDAVAVEIEGSERVVRPLFGPGGVDLPAELAVVRVTEVEGMRARAELLSGGEVVAGGSASAAFVPGRQLILELPVVRACVGVSCPPGQSCGAGGECEDEARGPLPDYAGTPEPIPQTGCIDPCDDGVACTVDLLVDGACTHQPDDAQCTATDGGRCDATTDCQYPRCSAATCFPLSACRTAVCEGETCRQDSICPDGVRCCGGECCDDGDPCTTDGCDGDTCVHNPVVCSGSTQCSRVECIGTGCTPTYLEGTPCTHPDPCIENAFCDAAGACVGTPKSCNDGNRCTVDSCVPGFGCENDSAPRDGKSCAHTPEECMQGLTCDGDMCRASPTNRCNDADETCCYQSGFFECRVTIIC